MPVESSQVYLEPTFCPIVIPANTIRAGEDRQVNGIWQTFAYIYPHDPGTGSIRTVPWRFGRVPHRLSIQQKIPGLSFGGSTMPVSDIGFGGSTGGGRYNTQTDILEFNLLKAPFTYSYHWRRRASRRRSSARVLDISPSLVRSQIRNGYSVGYRDRRYDATLYRYYPMSSGDIINYYNNRIGDPAYQAIYRCFNVCILNRTEGITAAGIYTLPSPHFNISMWRETTPTTILRGYDPPTGSSFTAHTSSTSMLSLGNLPANPTLAVYDWRGHLVSGTHYKVRGNLFETPFTGVRVWFKIEKKPSVSASTINSTYPLTTGSPAGVQGRNILNVRVRGTTTFRLNTNT